MGAVVLLAVVVRFPPLYVLTFYRFYVYISTILISLVAFDMCLLFFMLFFSPHTYHYASCAFGVLCLMHSMKLVLSISSCATQIIVWLRCCRQSNQQHQASTVPAELPKSVNKNKLQVVRHCFLMFSVSLGRELLRCHQVTIRAFSAQLFWLYHFVALSLNIPGLISLTFIQVDQC